MLKRLITNQKVYVFLMVLLLTGAVPLFLISKLAYGAELNNRSVKISTAIPGAISNHTYTFDIASSGLLGSMEFEYCSNDPFVGAPCNAPAGLVVNGANLVGQTGETGFVIDPSSTANKLVLSRVPIPSVPQSVSYSLNDIINPTTLGTIYVRISTFASNDATGPRIDTGSVVFSTSVGLGAVGYVPPFLIFCVGVTVGPDCSSVTGHSINLGILSPDSPSVATTQFSGATNDYTGYSVSIFGTTMTSGTNIIPALAVPSPSNPGTSQYGLNLRGNNNPIVGQDPSGIGTANVEPNYNTPNQFAYINGSQLVSSSLSTDFNIFTVSYLVNTSIAQAAGIYNTTATFVATASF